ncbi:MAG: DUF2705 family protein [Anaerostipes sp.]|nr:DUF2705 family protein [Anaerostipes sp.]
MKKNSQWNILFLILSMVFQSYFFYLRGMGYAFVYAIGVNVEKNQGGFPYMEMCFMCLPIFFILLLFSEYYTFYMENYGRVLVIRNCKRWKICMKMYQHIVIKLLIIVGTQWLINFIFFRKIFMGNIEIVTKGSILYFFLLLLLALIQILLCTFVQENTVQIILNLYVFLSCIMMWFFRTDITLLFFPGKASLMKVYLKEFCVGSHFYEKVGIDFMMLIVIGAITIIRYKKKDIY